jgi:hypothetical protein
MCDQPTRGCLHSERVDGAKGADAIAKAWHPLQLDQQAGGLRDAATRADVDAQNRMQLDAIWSEAALMV